MTSMDLRRLRLFVAVAEAGGVGRAARVLGLAQPPLTVQIRRLEEEVGTPLFHRSAAGMTPTAAGHAFLARAKDALALAEEAAAAARAAAAGRGGRLTLGFMLVLAPALLPRLMPELRRAMPEVEFDLVEMTAATREAVVLGRAASVGLCMPALDHQDAEAECLAEVPLVLALPAADPLAVLRTVPVEALRGRPLVGVPRVRRDPAASAVARAFLRRHGLAAQLRQSVETVPAALALVAAGEGPAVVPAPAAACCPAGVVIRPMEGAAETVQLAACWRRDLPALPLRRFLAVARPVIAAVVEDGWRAGP
jgi:DNA-binding transcriptional LysR family regulator